MKLLEVLVAFLIIGLLSLTVAGLVGAAGSADAAATAATEAIALAQQDLSMLRLTAPSTLTSCDQGTTCIRFTQRQGGTNVPAQTAFCGYATVVPGWQGVRRLYGVQVVVGYGDRLRLADGTCPPSSGDLPSPTQGWREVVLQSALFIP